jgi:release factor glutamine methyltransferase
MQHILTLKKQLENAGYKSPQIFHHALLLLIKVTRQSAQDILTCKKPLTQDQQQKLDLIVYELTTLNKPLAYILEKIPFCNIELFIQPPVLIPRPETEEWVHALAIELAELRLRNRTTEEQKREFSILDVCTGSGCIALALAHELPHARVIGADICPAALVLAQKNQAKTNLNNCQFIQSNMFANITKTFDVIVANPPYVSETEWTTLAPHITRWENKQALVAEQNGYAWAQHIIAHAPRFLKKSGLLALECGRDQAETLYTFAQSCGYTNIRIKRDFSGYNRVLMGNYEVVTHSAH